MYGCRRLLPAELPQEKDGDLRMGFAVKAAKLQTIYTMADEGDWRDSGVIYLGGETPLGSLDLGHGFSSGDHNLCFKLDAF